MDKPVNSKVRESAILKFALVCLIPLVLIGYHALITSSVLKVESKNNASLEQPVNAKK